MKLFWVCSIILVVLCLIGLVKIKVLFVSKSDLFFKVCLKILFFKFQVFSNFGKELSVSKSKCVEKKDKTLENLASKQQKSKRQQNRKRFSFFNKLNLISLLVGPTLKLLKFLNKGFKIKHFKINFELSGEDAYKTAIFYGKFCSYFYSLLKIFTGFCKVEVDQIQIVPNFKSETSNFNSSFYMQIAMGRLLTGLFIYVFTIIVKILFSKINKNKVLN